MGTTLRAELSEKNPYWIEKHRYYELKHFCLQYPIWKKAYAALDGTNTKTMNLAMRVITNNIDDPTSRYAIARTYYLLLLDYDTELRCSDRFLIPYQYQQVLLYIPNKKELHKS